MNSLKQFWEWFLYSARLVGAPILAFLLLWGTMKITYTGTCAIGGLKCEYAIGADDSMIAYMSDMLAANPGVDVVAKPRK